MYRFDECKYSSRLTKKKIEFCNRVHKKGISFIAL